MPGGVLHQTLWVRAYDGDKLEPIASIGANAYFVRDSAKLAGCFFPLHMAANASTVQYRVCVTGVLTNITAPSPSSFERCSAWVTNTGARARGAFRLPRVHVRESEYGGATLVRFLARTHDAPGAVYAAVGNAGELTCDVPRYADD
mmetsp:Transcript_55016/g.134933  ORF Transcript_55016/g.134933 Transcript_55016/m.134933 type:complete len:146 (+) Transcript_55016:236-673(+)